MTSTYDTEICIPHNGVEEVLTIPRRKTRKPIRYVIDGNGCHVCVSHTSNRQGYVKFTYKYRSTRMHRALYEIANGPIPDGMVVMHSCDNRRCINLAHLSLGTSKDNSHDMVTKGRSPRGAKQHLAKLTEEQVRVLRTTQFAKGGLKQAATDLGINYSTIKKVRALETWAHVL